MKNLTFAFSTSTVTNSKSNNEAINFSEMVNIIKNSNAPVFYNSIASTTIDGLYNDVDIKEIKKTISPLKLKLPFFLFSGYQAVGHNNKGIDYNGCVQIDIDFKEIYGEQMAQEAKDSLMRLPYIALAGISPSGVGVKALVKTDSLNKENHVAVLNQVINAICLDTNINKSYFDSVGASQPVFCFYDSDLYSNQDAEVYAHTTIAVKAKQSTKAVNLKAYNGIKLTSTLTESQIEKGLNIAFSCSQKRRGDTVDTTFLQTFCGITIKFGIEADRAFNYLVNKGYGSDLNTKRQNSLYDLYTRYEASFATAEISYEIAQVESDNTLNYKLEANQKLSHLDLDLSENSMIISPTASGKSYYIGTKLTMKRVMVVPTQSLVKQFANLYGASPFYQEEKELTNEDFIVTTYKSFSNLCGLINPSQYTLFIDEAHSMTSSTSYNYLLTELNEVVDLLGVFKAYHLLTATPLFSFDKRISSLRLIKVTKPLTYDKNVYDIRYEDFYKTLADRVDATVSKGGQFVVLSNNTKETGKLGRIKATLNSHNTVIINSTKKDQDSFIEVAIDGDMSKCDGIISTSIIKEGNSITKHNDLVEVYIDGNFHPVELEQFSARFRNVKTVNMYIMKSNKLQDSFCNFNLQRSCDSLLELVDTHKSFADTIRKSQFAMREQLNLLADMDKFYFKRVGNEIETDWLSLSNIIFEKEKQAANNDYEYMTQYLSGFGWNDFGTVNDNALLTNNEKSNIDDAIKLSKADKQLKIETILSQVADESAYHNSDLVKANTVTDQIEKDVRYKLDVISKYNDDELTLTSSVETLNNIGLSTQGWTQFTKAVNVQKLRTNSKFMKSNSDMAKFIKAIYKAFKVDEKYSTDQIETKINKLMMKFFGTEMTKNKAIKLLSIFFSSNRVSTRANGKIESQTLLTSDNASGVDIDTDKYFSEREASEMSYMIF